CRPAAVQNTTCVSIGGQPGTWQAISDTMTVSSSVSSKRRRIQPRRRSVKALFCWSFLMKPSMTNHLPGLVSGVHDFIHLNREGHGWPERLRPDGEEKAEKGRERVRKSTSGGADRTQQDRTARISDAGHPGG